MNSFHVGFRLYLLHNQAKGDAGMADTRNLCAQIPTTLPARVTEAREKAGQSNSEYITNLLIEYFNMKENGGNNTMANGSRTMAFTISEELFRRIKAHLDRESARTGKRLTQREFVLGLIEAALNEAESQTAEDGQMLDQENQQDTSVEEAQPA